MSAVWNIQSNRVGYLAPQNRINTSFIAGDRVWFVNPSGFRTQMSDGWMKPDSTAFLPTDKSILRMPVLASSYKPAHTWFDPYLPEENIIIPGFNSARNRQPSQRSNTSYQISTEAEEVPPDDTVPPAPFANTPEEQKAQKEQRERFENSSQQKAYREEQQRKMDLLFAHQAAKERAAKEEASRQEAARQNEKEPEKDYKEGELPGFNDGILNGKDVGSKRGASKDLEAPKSPGKKSKADDEQTEDEIRLKKERAEYEANIKLAYAKKVEKAKQELLDKEAKERQERSDTQQQHFADVVRHLNDALPKAKETRSAAEDADRKESTMETRKALKVAKEEVEVYSNFGMEMKPLYEGIKKGNYDELQLENFINRYVDYFNSKTPSPYSVVESPTPAPVTKKEKKLRPSGGPIPEPIPVSPTIKPVETPPVSSPTVPSAPAQTNPGLPATSTAAQAYTPPAPPAASTHAPKTLKPPTTPTVSTPSPKLPEVPQVADIDASVLSSIPETKKPSKPSTPPSTPLPTSTKSSAMDSRHPTSPYISNAKPTEKPTKPYVTPLLPGIATNFENPTPSKVSVSPEASMEKESSPVLSPISETSETESLTEMANQAVEETRFKALSQQIPVVELSRLDQPSQVQMSSALSPDAASKINEELRQQQERDRAAQEQTHAFFADFNRNAAIMQEYQERIHSMPVNSEFRTVLQNAIQTLVNENDILLEHGYKESQTMLPTNDYRKQVEQFYLRQRRIVTNVENQQRQALAAERLPPEEQKNAISPPLSPREPAATEQDIMQNLVGYAAMFSRNITFEYTISQLEALQRMYRNYKSAYVEHQLALESSSSKIMGDRVTWFDKLSPEQFQDEYLRPFDYDWGTLFTSGVLNRYMSPEQQKVVFWAHEYNQALDAFYESATPNNQLEEDIQRLRFARRQLEFSTSMLGTSSGYTARRDAQLVADQEALIRRRHIPQEVRVDLLAPPISYAEIAAPFVESQAESNLRLKIWNERNQFMD